MKILWKPSRLNAESGKGTHVPPTLCHRHGVPFKDTHNSRSIWGLQFPPQMLQDETKPSMFADDLMLFCKGDMLSIKILCQGVQLFSSSSGLEANYTKSGIYLARVREHFRHMQLVPLILLLRASLWSTSACLSPTNGTQQLIVTTSWIRWLTGFVHGLPETSPIQPHSSWLTRFLLASLTTGVKLLFFPNES